MPHDPTKDKGPAALPKGAGKAWDGKARVSRMGRKVAGLGRRSSAPRPITHGPGNPSHVHAPPALIDRHEILAIRTGLYLRGTDGKLIRDYAGKFMLDPNSPFPSNNPPAPAPVVPRIAIDATASEAN